MKQLHITPEGTYIDGKLEAVDYIILSLPDGRTIDIDSTVTILTKKLPKPSRIKAALKTLREGVDIDTPPHLSETP